MDKAQEVEQQIAEDIARPLDERLADLPRQLAGLQLELQVPRRLIERDEILDAASTMGDRPYSAARVLAAALLLCWPSAQRRAGVPKYTGDILAYGGAVYDFLLGNGATTIELLRAGGVAVALCSKAFGEQLEAQKIARGNSEGPAEPKSANRSQSNSASVSASVVLASSTRQTQES